MTIRFAFNLLIYTIFLLISGVMTVEAQAVDEEPSVASAREYLKQGIRFYQQRKFDSAIIHFQRSTQLAIINQEFELAGQALNNMGVISNRLGDYKSGILYYEDAVEQLKKANEPKQIASMQINLAQAYKGMNIYDKATENLYEAIKVLDSLEMHKVLASAYSTLGNIHREAGTMEVALRYLNESLRLREEMGHGSGVAKSLQNLGNWYYDQEEYSQARERYLASLEIKQELKDSSSMASTLAKLGQVAVRLENLPRALELFQSSLDIRLKFRNKAGIATSSNHLAKVYLLMGRPESAYALLTRAIEIAQEGALLSEQANALELLKVYYSETGEYQLALEASNQLMIINDSILNKEKARSLMEAQIRFELDSKNRELRFQKATVDSLEKEKIYLLVIALALFVMSVLFVFFFKESRKLAKTRRIGKERVERLLMELNHRTKNHLQTQSGLIKQHMLKLKDQTTVDVIRDIDNQIKSINLIHQSLYTSTEEAPESIDLTNYIRNIVENLMISFGMTRNQVNLDFDLDEVDIDIHQALPVGLILNEAVTNVFKHAFPKLDLKELKISLKKTAQHLILTVRDNGAGFQCLENGKLNKGLSIMRELAGDLGGNFVAGNQAGGLVSLTLEYKE